MVKLTTDEKTSDIDLAARKKFSHIYELKITCKASSVTLFSATSTSGQVKLCALISSEKRVCIVTNNFRLEIDFMKLDGSKFDTVC